MTILTLIAALVLLAVLLKLLFPLPDRGDFPADPPVTVTQSELAGPVAQLTASHPGDTGLLVLDTGIEALAMRLAMVRHAERTIDAQYYIWEDDLTGRMLLREIIAAADRGVRVRLLIDDNPTSGLDPMWAAVASHPRIAVRLFNPFTIRRVRALNYLFDFPRLNRRMHNKSLTVDSVATIIGGRNIGDVYFGAAEEGLFIDLDALAVGAVVPDVDTEFQSYWESQSAYPAEAILKPVPAAAIAGWRDPQFDDEGRAHAYAEAVEAAYASLNLEGEDDPLIWAPVTLFADPPAKGLGTVAENELMAAELAPLFEEARERLDLVSGYFVPGELGSSLLMDAAERGVETRAVTNSIQVTDVPVVHAGYVPYRPALLRAGVQLYEARPLKERGERTASNLGSLRFSGGGESVHAKTFAIDDEYLFIGSFNFDPRSALLNCEMGFLIQSPEMARAMHAQLGESLEDAAYALSLAPSGDMVWTSTQDGRTVDETVEPGTTGPARTIIWALSKLPIAWML